MSECEQHSWECKQDNDRSFLKCIECGFEENEKVCNRFKLLRDILDQFEKPGYDFKSTAFKQWFRGWINEVDCELNPDPWMNEPLTPEEIVSFEAAEKEEGKEW